MTNTASNFARRLKWLNNLLAGRRMLLMIEDIKTPEHGA